MKSLVERLRDYCVDWNGGDIVDGSTPRIEILCGEIREAADRIEQLEAKQRALALDTLSALGQADEAYEKQKQLEADVARLREALSDASHFFDEDTTILHKIDAALAGEHK